MQNNLADVLRALVRGVNGWLKFWWHGHVVGSCGLQLPVHQ
jgi:hypothetical protein